MRILNAQETKQVSGGVTIPGFGGNWGGPTTIPVEPTTPNAPSGAGAGSNGAPAPTNSTPIPSFGNPVFYQPRPEEY
jgi:hypothetical protein